jgi:putative ABC transport system permease protein
MTRLMEDIRFAFRMLWKSPGTTIAALLTLALGIGATTALFSLTWATLARPMPYPEPERLAVLTQRSEQIEEISINRLDFADWRRQNTLFEEMAIFRGTNLNLTGGDQPERLQGLEVSSSIFKTLGIQPAVGRPFSAEADGPGAERQVLISNSLWQGRFGGDPQILGRSLQLDGETYLIIGVLPASFDGEELKWYRLGDVWMPFGLTLKDLPENRGYGAGHLALARFKTGVTEQAARSELEGLAERQAYEFPDSNTGKGLTMTTVREEEVGNIRPALLTAFFAVAFLLLIACTNVANLQLTRAAERGRELTLRTALGAGRKRIMAQLLTESLVLAGIGGGLGVLTALGGVRFLSATLPEDGPVGLEQVAFDGRALAFALVVSVLTGLLFGLLPALTASRTDLREALSDSSGRSVSAGKGQRRLSQFLVVGEVALSLLLLVGAGLTLQSLKALRQVNPGFDPQGVLSFRVPLSDAKYSPDRRWQRFYEDLLQRIEALPGVESAAFSSLLPLISGSSETFVLAEGQPLPQSPGEARSTLWHMVTPDYFKTLSIELIEGRLFADQDLDDAPHVAVVDETMAATLWPGQNPLGKRLAIEFQRRDFQDPGPLYREVVGVVRHVRHYRLDRDSRVEVYIPQSQPHAMTTSAPALWGTVRTSGDPSLLAGPIRQLVQEIDADQPIYAVQPMSEGVASHWAQSQMLSRILAAFALAALLLASIGLYGVIADSVTRRTQEFGVRLALGAGRERVLRMVLRQGVLLALFGVLVGGAAAFALTRLLASQLYQVAPRDPALFAVVAAFLLVLAAAATLIPAWRATRVEPMTALRYE